MTYEIDTEKLYARIEKEISRVAASSYSDDGVSLYDSIKVTSRDGDIIKEYCQGAVNAISVAFAEYATKGAENITLDFPDFDISLKSSVQEELDRYIVYRACSDWFRDKSVKDVAPYTERAAESLSKANLLLKSRKPPKRQYL